MGGKSSAVQGLKTIVHRGWFCKHFISPGDTECDRWDGHLILWFRAIVLEIIPPDAGVRSELVGELPPVAVRDFYGRDQLDEHRDQHHQGNNPERDRDAYAKGHAIELGTDPIVRSLHEGTEHSGDGPHWGDLCCMFHGRNYGLWTV